MIKTFYTASLYNILALSCYDALLLVLPFNLIIYAAYYLHFADTDILADTIVIWLVSVLLYYIVRLQKTHVSILIEYCLYSALFSGHLLGHLSIFLSP